MDELTLFTESVVAGYRNDIRLQLADTSQSWIGWGRAVHASFIEPAAEADEASGQTVHAAAIDNRAFQAKRTPGYYNGDGTEATGTPRGATS